MGDPSETDYLLQLRLRAGEPTFFGRVLRSHRDEAGNLVIDEVEWKGVEQLEQFTPTGIVNEHDIEVQYADDQLIDVTFPAIRREAWDDEYWNREVLGKFIETGVDEHGWFATPVVSQEILFDRNGDVLFDPWHGWVGLDQFDTDSQEFAALYPRQKEFEAWERIAHRYGDWYKAGYRFFEYQYDIDYNLDRWVEVFWGRGLPPGLQVDRYAKCVDRGVERTQARTSSDD